MNKSRCQIIGTKNSKSISFQNVSDCFFFRQRSASVVSSWQQRFLVGTPRLRASMEFRCRSMYSLDWRARQISFLFSPYDVLTFLCLESHTFDVVQFVKARTERRKFRVYKIIHTHSGGSFHSSLRDIQHPLSIEVFQHLAHGEKK
jgi:hypothetical protein